MQKSKWFILIPALLLVAALAAGCGGGKDKDLFYNKIVTGGGDGL